MEELSLHILDIAENSIRAGAKNIEIHIEEDSKNDRLTIVIRDDGAGMDEATSEQVLDPFFTTKQGKRVGLGLPLLAAAARRAGGQMQVKSSPRGGTEVVATFQHSHIDRQPLGDMGKTVEMLIIGNPEVEFLFAGHGSGRKWWLDTRGIKKALGKVPICSGEGIRMVRELLKAQGWGEAGG